MGLTETIINFATAVIDKTSYFGVAFLMTLESMVAPVPSEAVMPFAGFLWYDGRLSFWPIVFASTTGSIIGSLISYYIGAYGGRPLVKRFGKYFLLNEHHLDKTEQFFQRHGEKTIFISRFIPVVRHLISIPAGIGQMRLGKFIFYTTVGAGIWNAFLTWLGFQLRSNWEIIRKYAELVDIIIIIAIIVIIIYFIRKRRTVVSSKKKLLIFTEGTIIMHKNAVGHSREEIVKQVKIRDKSVHDYSLYVPIGAAAQKLAVWKNQDVAIFYLTSRTDSKEVEAIRNVLKKNNFPNGELLHRRKRGEYEDIAERIMPDILIEDDCESIGGSAAMTIAHVRPNVKKKIKSIVVEEFGGIDLLPDDISSLTKY